MNLIEFVESESMIYFVMEIYF